MEIVVRSIVIYLFLWMVTRAVGRSSLGELSTFQLLLYVTMGDLVQQAITQQDYSVIGGILAVSTFALLTVGFGVVERRFRRLRPIIAGIPLVIVKDGQPLEEPMRRERMTIEELYADARQQGISDLAVVKLAVLETNGKVSFFTREGEDGEDGAPDSQPDAA